MENYLEAYSQRTTKVFNRACKADPKEKLFLKNFQRFKKNKKCNTQPTLNDTKTQQRQWFTSTVDRNAST